MSRYRAAAIHLGLSAVVFCALAYFVVFVWYPNFFFETDGGWQGMRLIIFVDLVLGPLLTLIVFKAGKPGLAFDLSAIGALQLACLCAGVWLVWNERPIALVYVDGHFYSMNADAYQEEGVDAPDLASFDGVTPKWLSVDVPEDATAQSELRGTMWDQGRPMRVLVDRYVPFDPTALSIRDAVPSDLLRDRDQESGDLSKWIDRHGGSIDDYLFYPYGARYAFVFLGFSARDHRFIGLLETSAG